MRPQWMLDVLSLPLATRFNGMDLAESLGSIMLWDEYDVHVWLSGLGLSQYEDQVREHHITGDILVQLTAESLKEIGIETVGQRLLILKAVYEVKLAQGVEIEADHYIPPSAQSPTYWPGHSGCVIASDKLCSAFVSETDTLFGDDTRLNDIKDRRRWSETYDVHGLRVNVHLEPNTCAPPKVHSASSSDARPSLPCAPERGRIIPNSEQNGKVDIDDPLWKVLPVALKKHNITEDWRNYIMFICYGQTELRLAHHDRPRRVFKKLQEENKNPVFVLRHISEIDSDSSCSAYNSACSGGVTYAIAIYPYESSKGALSKIIPGDAFIITSKGRDRWLVQRDPSGTGIMSSTQEHLEIRPGCLLETDIPIAFASAAAFATRASHIRSPIRRHLASNSPILPRNVISSGFAATALKAYRELNDEGVDLVRGEVIHVFKRYRNLAYVVKEDGDHGWIPIWLVSKSYYPRT